jgi:serine/threonine protein kinase
VCLWHFVRTPQCYAAVQFNPFIAQTESGEQTSSGMEAEDFLWDDFDAPNLESSQSKVKIAEAEAGPEIEGLASFHQLIYELNIWSYGLLRFPGYSRHIGIGETFQVDAVVSASLIPVCSVRDIVDMKETSTPTPGRIVAVKSLQTAFSYMNDAPSLNKGLLTKMILELRTLKLMSDYGCENVIKILGVAWRQEYSGAFTLIRPCLVVEYADIGTLTDFVKLTEDPRSEIVKMGFLGDIASALDCLLQNNIVHNDLKPDNVLIFQKEEGFTAKLSDFGHSIYLLGDWESCDRIIPGDETWASPELLMPVQRISPHLLPRVDVYSYGLLAWWLLIDGRNFLAASDNLEHTKTNSYESKISNQFEQLAIEDTYRLEKRGLADIAQSFRKIFRMSLPTLPEDRVSSYSAILDVTGPSTNNQRAEQTTSRCAYTLHQKL